MKVTQNFTNSEWFFFHSPTSSSRSRNLEFLHNQISKFLCGYWQQISSKLDDFCINKKLNLKKASLIKPPQSYPWQSILKIDGRKFLLLFLRRSFSTKRSAKGMTILQKMKMNNFQPPIDANNYLIRCNKNLAEFKLTYRTTALF